MDPRFAQDNPWIAQIHASRITYTPSVNDTMFFFSVHLKYKYPVDDKEEQTWWKGVLNKLNAKCRSFRRPPHHRGRRAGSTS